ncbi:GntR family transcriptional regulator [Phenylobacterium sp.]|uniref:GntR family transcriptional regulator n=1 Tax=Phenylobacterium sp. TaxID=1871053 RepID=UPI002FCADBA7
MTRDSSLTHEVYERLRSDLLAGRFHPGDRLRISELCNAMGVSLGAVREALSRLTSEGLVVLEPQRGFSVAPISQRELLDLTQVRADIEGQCLRRAIAAGDVAWEAQIVAAFHAWSKTWQATPRDGDDEAGRTHAAFHRALLSGCDSPWLLKLRDLLFAQSERYRRLSKPLDGANRDLLAEHRDLMEATLARDADRATTLLAEHFAATARILVERQLVAADLPAVPRRTVHPA